MNMYNKLPDPEDAVSFPSPAGDAASRRKRLLLIGAAVAAAVLLVFAASRFLGSGPATEAPAVQLPNVTVMVPGTSVVADFITAPGSIAAKRDEGVGVQGEGGRVIAVLVEPGQQVKAGQLLARIDRSVQAQQAARLAAEVRAAEADAALAEANLQRALGLVERGFVSKADVDQRTATRDAARARVAVARAQLGEINARIGLLDITAPRAGLVLARNVEVGQVVGSGSQPLFRLAEGGVLEMRVQVAEQDIARLKPGMKARVTPVGARESYEGEIWLIDPLIDIASRQGIVRIALPYSPGLRVGAFARAEIEAGRGERPVVPQSAILTDEKGSYVMVVGAENRVERRDISVGSVTDNGVAIASGLDGREKVVVSAGAFLRPGEAIKPIIAGTEPSPRD